MPVQSPNRSPVRCARDRVFSDCAVDGIWLTRRGQVDYSGQAGERCDDGRCYLGHALYGNGRGLRVLQDQEFERLGSTRTIRVNVRLVAATNHDLAKNIAEGQFRSDLFYRLHVFPIRMPPLRERRQDIPALVRYFVQKLARRMGKQIDTIPIETMNKMMDWNWPGNIRELENLVERSVILTKGSILHVPLAELRPQPENTETDGTLEATDREHIIRVLRETRGVLSGPAGAAARLGLQRTTLQSKMKRLGIERKDYED